MSGVKHNCNEQVVDTLQNGILWDKDSAVQIEAMTLPVSFSFVFTWIFKTSIVTLDAEIYS